MIDLLTRDFFPPSCRHPQRLYLDAFTARVQAGQGPRSAEGEESADQGVRCWPRERAGGPQGQAESIPGPRAAAATQTGPRAQTVAAERGNRSARNHFDQLHRRYVHLNQSLPDSKASWRFRDIEAVPLGFAGC